MTGVWDRPTHVRGNHFRANDGKIYLTSDFGLIYTKNGTDYHPTFQTFNTMDCWRAAENGPFLYADGYGKWMDGDLGISTKRRRRKTGAQPVVDTEATIYKI